MTTSNYSENIVELLRKRRELLTLAEAEPWFREKILNEGRVTGLPYVRADRGVAILHLDGDLSRCYKFVTQKASPDSVEDGSDRETFELSSKHELDAYDTLAVSRSRAIVERGLRNQHIASRLGVESVQGIESPKPFEDIQGLYQLDFVPGETLNDVGIGYLLDRERILDDFLELERDLTTYQGLGILHRDIKPSNVVLDKRSGRLVLIDWAAGANFLEEAADKIINRVFIGTEGFRYRGSEHTFSMDHVGLGLTFLKVLYPFVKLPRVRDEAFLLDASESLGRISPAYGELFDRLVTTPAPYKYVDDPGRTTLRDALNKYALRLTLPGKRLVRDGRLLEARYDPHRTLDECLESVTEDVEEAPTFVMEFAYDASLAGAQA